VAAFTAAPQYNLFPVLPEFCLPLEKLSGIIPLHERSLKNPTQNRR
jgi:hypothetical protein